MRIIATPIVAVKQTFEDHDDALLAAFVLGLDLGRKDPAIAGRMSEVGQRILNCGDQFSDEGLDQTIDLVRLLFMLSDLQKTL
jgi:hypothetical protein